MTRTLLVAIAKDEGPYLREWILYHKKVCGFDDIFVYDNDSSDGSGQTLDDIKKEGLCDWKPWSRNQHNPPQQTAYGDALLKKDDYDWVCLLDADEFLVLKSGESIGEFLSGFEKDVGSVSFNWAVFYSLDKTRSTEPVTKRILNCYGDAHVKTIARSKAIKGAMIHTFTLLPGYKYMHCSGAEYEVAQGDNTDAKMCVDGDCKKFDFGTAQVNHYLVKSEEDVLRKDEKGDATTREYRRKNVKDFYDNLARVREHRENHSIKEYIEARCGLDRFYGELG